MKNQIYDSFVTSVQEIDKMNIQYPHLRKYLAEKDVEINLKELGDEAERLWAMVELSMDTLEKVEAYLDCIPKEQQETWIDYMNTVRQSAAYRYYINNVDPGYYAHNFSTEDRIN